MKLPCTVYPSFSANRLHSSGDVITVLSASAMIVAVPSVVGYASSALYLTRSAESISLTNTPVVHDSQLSEGSALESGHTS